jgi:nucleoside-diphosphate-sugar epimerase
MPAPVLVTGATGFVGRHLVDALRKSGRPVRALVRDPAKFRAVFPNPSGIDLYPGDLGDAGTLAGAIQGAEVIFHLAGVTKVLHLTDFDRFNHQAARSLYEAVRSQGAGPRIVHVSSLAAAGPSPSPDPPEDFLEARPVTAYGRSKLLGEQALREILPGAPWTIVRPPVVFGPGDMDVLHFFRAVARGLNPILGHDRKKVSLAYVSDLAEALVRAADSTPAVGKTYYVCYDRAYRWSELGALAASLMGRPCRSVAIPLEIAWAGAAITQILGWLRRRPTILNLEKLREAEQDYWICSPAAAVRDFGFRPVKSIEEAFAETIAWYRENGHLPSH